MRGGRVIGDHPIYKFFLLVTLVTSVVESRHFCWLGWDGMDQVRQGGDETCRVGSHTYKSAAVRISHVAHSGTLLEFPDPLFGKAGRQAGRQAIQVVKDRHW